MDKTSGWLMAGSVDLSPLKNPFFCPIRRRRTSLCACPVNYGTYFLFPLSYFLFPISSFLFPISSFLLSYFPLSSFLFPLSSFLFPLSYFLFPISSFLFPLSSFLFSLSYFLFTVHYPSNCSSSVEPAKAAVAVSPPLITI